MATRAEISQFLSTINSIGNIRIVNTEKNRETRYRLGITVEDQKDLIRNLRVSDYISGPEDDYDISRSGEIWKFKVNAYNEVFYIKLKLEISSEIKALSCHIDNIII